MLMKFSKVIKFFSSKDANLGFTLDSIRAKDFLPLEQQEREQKENWDWISIKKIIIILIPGIKPGQNPV